jgi:hypothetical protein
MWAGNGIAVRVVGLPRVSRHENAAMPFLYAKNGRWRLAPSCGLLLSVEGWRHTYNLITIYAKAMTEGKRG